MKRALVRWLFSSAPVIPQVSCDACSIRDEIREMRAEIRAQHELLLRLLGEAVTPPDGTRVAMARAP